MASNVEVWHRLPCVHDDRHCSPAAAICLCLPRLSTCSTHKVGACRGLYGCNMTLSSSVMAHSTSNDFLPSVTVTRRYDGIRRTEYLDEQQETEWKGERLGNSLGLPFL